MRHAPSYNTELPPQCGNAWACKQGHHHKSSYTQGVETLSQLSDILQHLSAPHILCIQFSFNLPDIR